jgi:hypothetical protein
MRVESFAAHVFGQYLEPITQTTVKPFAVSRQSIHKGGVRQESAAEFQIVTDFPRLIERIRDVLRFLPRPDQRLCHDFLRIPFDVAMKFTFVKQFTGWNEPSDKFPKQFVIFGRPLFLALVLVCTFGGALLLPATHGQIPF